MKVSVVIPVYNAGSTVAEAVASALEQPEAAEVVLVEDGSADDSLAVSQRLAEAHERVRVVQHPGGANRGAAESRQLGIASARFEFVAFLDADDVYLPGRFRAAAARLADDPTIDGVYDAVGVHLGNDDAAAWWQSNKGHTIATMKPGIEPDRLFVELVGGLNGFLQTNGVLARRSLFERAGGFSSSLWIAEDLFAWLRLTALGRFVGGSLKEPVALYRIHGSNTVIRHFEDHDHQRRLMWIALARWLDERQIYGERMAVVLHQVALPGVRHRTLQRSRLGRRVEAVAALARLVAAHPPIVRRPEFARTVAKVAGLVWFRDVLLGRRSDAPRQAAVDGQARG